MCQDSGCTAEDVGAVSTRNRSSPAERPPGTGVLWEGQPRETPVLPDRCRWGEQVQKTNPVHRPVFESAKDARGLPCGSPRNA